MDTANGHAYEGMFRYFGTNFSDRYWVLDVGALPVVIDFYIRLLAITK